MDVSTTCWLRGTLGFIDGDPPRLVGTPTQALSAAGFPRVGETLLHGGPAVLKRQPVWQWNCSMAQLQIVKDVRNGEGLRGTAYIALAEPHLLLNNGQDPLPPSPEYPLKQSRLEGQRSPALAHPPRPPFQLSARYARPTYHVDIRDVLPEIRRLAESQPRLDLEKKATDQHRFDGAILFGPRADLHFVFTPDDSFWEQIAHTSCVHGRRTGGN